jgi:hypothetical protein
MKQAVFKPGVQPKTATTMQLLTSNESIAPQGAGVPSVHVPIMVYLTICTIDGMLPGRLTAELAP